MMISIAKDFSVTPGSRYKDEGGASGEDFRQRLLEPKFKESLTTGEKITVNLDGTLGYGTSFLEEVFGGLARQYGVEKVLSLIEVVSTEEPYLVDDVKEYITNANG